MTNSNRKIKLMAGFSLCNFAIGAQAGVTDIAKIACNDVRQPNMPVSISVNDLAESVIVAAGRRPSKVGQGSANLVEAVFKNGDATIASSVRSLVVALAIDPKNSSQTLKLNIEPAPPTTAGYRWIFDNQDAIKIYCLPGKAANSDPYPIVTDIEGRMTPIGRFAIGEKIADLAKFDDAIGRRSGEPASIAFVRQRERKTDDAGLTTSKTTSTSSITGTAGIRITGDSNLNPAFFYASYRLGRSRVKPQPILEDGKSEADSDVNALEIGLSQSEFGIGDAITVSAEAGYVLNFTDKSERLTARLTAEPALDFSAGICGFGTVVIIGSLKSSCYAAVSADYGNVTRQGKEKFEGYGNFLAIGGVIGIDMAPATADEGFVLSVRYRYLPVVSGNSADIDRLDASIAYRWWINPRVALQLGPSYKHGIEIKSLAVEDEISLKFGVLF
ncbi:MAG: hypothetical protein ACOYLK_09740 [Sphingomonas sp.]